MFGRILSVVFCACLVLPAPLFGQFTLEAPQNGGKESGLGDVHGWKCSGSNFTYTINNSAHIALAYGILRNDTIGQCGDANNGFISQQNWNFLPPGQYTLRVFDNGVQFAQATFSVANLGTEFLTGASGTYQLNFAGQTVTIQWQENKQNFTITSASGGGGGGTALSDLIGQWAFIYTIISTFNDHFSLPAPTSQNGIPVILGTDLDFGGPIIAARIEDLVPGAITPFEFALLDPDFGLCDFFVFNKTGTNTVSGQYYLVFINAGGDCESLLSGSAYPMSGIRFSTIPLLAQHTPGDSTTVDTQKKAEAASAPLVQGQATEPVAMGEADVQELLRVLSGALGAQP